MIFIGVISERQKFEILKKNINKNENDITLININKNSIENLTSVKFDAIVIIDSLEKVEDKINNLEEMCKNLKYLIINSDIEIKTNILSNIKANIITYGGNHTSTVTFSSITDEMILISVQRNFTNKKGKIIEVGEYNYKIDGQKRSNLYDILVEFIVQKLYNFS